MEFLAFKVFDNVIRMHYWLTPLNHEVIQKLAIKNIKNQLSTAHQTQLILSELMCSPTLFEPNYEHQIGNISVIYPERPHEATAWYGQLAPGDGFVKELRVEESSL